MSVNSLSQSDLNGNETFYDPSYFQIQHYNDLNFILPNQKTNDNGFTGAFVYSLFLNQSEEKNRLINLGFQTDLYTKKTGERFYENGRLIVAELFTEISTFDIFVTRFIKEKQWAFQFGGGIGLINKKKAIPFGALWLQGGMDGKGVDCTNSLNRPWSRIQWAGKHIQG